MSGDAVPPGPSEEPRVQWPYKYLWNVLRGESIVADDDVILEELRIAYEQIIRALTQYPELGEVNEDETPAAATLTSTGTLGASSATTTADAGGGGDATATGQPSTSTEAASSSGNGGTPSATTTADNEKKLKKRISVQLDLEESVAWEVFCSYIMFEYKGGSTSFEKLLENPRVSTDFLTDLKQYYEQERLAVLLVIQAIFGYASQTEHKYNRIFRAVCEWMKQDEAAALTKNLVKSLEMSANAEEEVQILNALTVFICHMPSRGIEDFCKEFTSFKPGRKEKKVLLAESALMYTLMNFPLLQEAEEEVAISMRQSVERLLELKADDMLMNVYSLGAVMSGHFSTCYKNKNVRTIIGHPKHQYDQTFAKMVELAAAYSTDSVDNNRNNLGTVVLKSLFFALRALAEAFTGDRIFRCGSQDDLYLLAASLMDHPEVAALLCSDEGSVLQATVLTSMAEFPLKLRHITNIWSSLCGANAQFPNQCIPLLKDCCKMVTTLAERVEDPSKVQEIVDTYTNNGYKLLRPRQVCGVELPIDTELERIDEDADGNFFTLYWRIPSDFVIDVFTVINNQLLIPLATQLQSNTFGHVPIRDLIGWTKDPNENIWSVLNFLVRYASSAPAITESLRMQYEPMSFIVFKTLDYVVQWPVKSKLCSQLIDLLVAANKFGVQNWSLIYFSEVWPTKTESSSFISDIIMGYESVANNDCHVTIAFLKSILTFFKGTGGSLHFADEVEERVAYNSVDFVNENVFHSFTRWRFTNAEAKYKILLNCLKVYSCVFDVPSPAWLDLKRACAKCLLVSHSSMMTALSASDDMLQLSVLQPTKDTYLVPDIIYHSLAVLLKLFQFENRSIKMVDESLGSTLVQKMGRFARHRLDYKIPTLAMALLKKIAEEMNMSLLSCFGSEEVAFRDLISQRLEFRSEDVNLKVSILDFLTVAAHTQPGLIQYIFMDDFLAQKIVDLPTEKDEALALAVLCFLRALFRKGTNVMKKCLNLWENVFYAINQIQPGGRLKIITCTMNIASLELFRFGMVNAKFAVEIKALLKEENFMRLVEMPLKQNTEHTTKCLLSIKHFISVVLHRNDMEDCFNEPMRKSVLELITNEYWASKEDEETDPHLSKVMVDLMCQLVNCLNDAVYVQNYLHSLADNLGKYFVTDTVVVQIGILALTNICVKRFPHGELCSPTLEHILRVVAKVFDNASKIFNHPSDPDNETIGPLITLSASIILTVIKNVKVEEWQNLFHRYMIPNAIVHATHLGIDKCRKEEILLELLYVLLKMAEVKECAESLTSSLVVQKVFLLVFRNASQEVSDGSKWTKIYLITLQIMTQLLRTEKIFFIEHSLNLWGNHGSHIIDQLNSFPGMTNACKINHPEYNFRMMKNLLTFSVYALDAISAMIPFWKQWTLNNGYEQLNVLEAVYTAMQTSVNLLDQPQYLQSFISHAPLHKQTGTSFSESRPTPHLMELHSKLWDIIHSSTFIYWSLRTWTDGGESSGRILAAANQVAQSCIKALTKPERRSHSSGSSHTTPTSSSHHHIATTANTARIMDTLERTLSLYLYHARKILNDPSITPKQKQNVTREAASDTGTLCDGSRRVTLSHPNELLTILCLSLESEFK